MEELGISLVQNSLHPIHEWGIYIIQLFQKFQNPVIIGIAHFFTFLGDPLFYLILLPVVFWCVNEKRGFKIGCIVFVSNGINIALKNFLQISRPYTHDSSIKMIRETGYSTPSGHSQNSSVLWPSISLTGKPRKNSFRFSIILPILIGLSRIYLGVHYPTDVFLGWTIGAIIIIFAFYVLPKILRWWQNAKQGFLEPIYLSFQNHKKNNPKANIIWLLILVALVSIILNCISPVDSSMAGMLFGFSAGYILLTQGAKQKFDARQGNFGKKLLRILIGFAGLILIYYGLKLILPGQDNAQYKLYRFLRYGLTGFWASFLAPQIFMKLKI